jgi:hypothetical protein
MRIARPVGLVLLAVVAIALGMFAAAPLDGLGLHPNVLVLQAQFKASIGVLAPYLFVGALGAGVGLAELTSTFGDYPREAVATRWGGLLIWLNAVAAALAYLIARVYAPVDMNPIVLIIMVGVGFQAFIRTKFTLAKQMGGSEGDLNLNIGWLYEQFQRLCKDQIDRELMRSRLELVEKLLARYSTPQLYTIARYTVQARATLTTEEEEARLGELKTIISDADGGPQSTRMNLALLILDIGGRSYVERLSEQPSRMPGQESEGAALLSEATPDAPTEALAKELTQLPLDDLVSLAKDVLKAPEDVEYVEEAAMPKPGMNEVRQKAPIAYYVVSRTSAETAQKALDKRRPPPA